jgi:hypothetical protein
LCRSSALLAFIFFALAIAGLLAGCSAPAQSTLSAREIVSTAGDKIQELNSFHFALDQVGGGTPIAMGIEMKKAEGDVVKPDKLKLTISGTALGFALQVQMVEVGKTAKMTNPLSGKWETLSDQFQILSVFDPGSGVASILRGLNNGIRLADEQSGGVNCYHLKGDISSESLSALAGSSVSGGTVAAEVWIGEADSLMRTAKLTGKITAGEVDGIVRTLSLSNFNVAVSIELPQ